MPSEDEVVEYAKWLGMDLDKDQDLFWVAREGVSCTPPKTLLPLIGALQHSFTLLTRSIHFDASLCS